MEMKNINSMPRRDDVVFPWKERNMNIWLDKLHGPPDKRETATLGPTKRDGGSGKHHTNNTNQNPHMNQPATRDPGRKCQTLGQNSWRDKMLTMEGGESETETEVFRAFRLTQTGAQRLSDGELGAVFQHNVDKMVAKDQSAVVIEHIRRQANLLEAMLERKRNPPPPPPNKYSWRKSFIGKRATAAPKDMATEVFNAIRLTDIEAQKLSHGKVQGVFHRVIVEMVSRDKTPLVIEYLQRRAGFLETIPERMAAPRAKKRTYLRYHVGAPQMAADKSIDGEPCIMDQWCDPSEQQGVADDAPFGGEDDTTPGERRGIKYEEEWLAKATAAATNWQARRDDEEKEDIEGGLWSLVLDDQTNADGGEDG